MTSTELKCYYILINFQRGASRLGRASGLGQVSKALQSQSKVSIRSVSRAQSKLSTHQRPQSKEGFGGRISEIEEEDEEVKMLSEVTKNIICCQKSPRTLFVVKNHQELHLLSKTTNNITWCQKTPRTSIVVKNSPRTSFVVKKHQELQLLSKNHQELHLLSKHHQELYLLSKHHQELYLLSKNHQELYLLSKNHQELYLAHLWFTGRSL